MTAARWPGRLLPAGVAGLAVWSLVPVGQWWAGAAPAEYAGVWNWWLTAALTAGLVCGLWILLWGRPVVTGARAAGQWVLGVPDLRFRIVAAVLIGALTLAVTLLVFEGNPRFVDGFAQLFHGRMLAAGRLWTDPPAHPAHFAVLNMLLGPDKWLSQYPPGQPLVLAAGLVLGAWWIFMPVIAAGLLLATMRVARWMAGEAVARLSAALLCLSPFAVALAATETSHLPAAALAMTAAAAAVGAGGRRPAVAAAGAGAALGLLAWFRPLDATAAALPVAVVLLLTARHRARAFSVLGIAGVLTVVPLLLYNAATTGAWWRFGYAAVWGGDLGLGSETVPYGEAPSVIRMIGLTGLDLHRLNSYLLDTSVPVLLFAAAAYLAGRRRLTARDAAAVVGILALVAALFPYWHRDLLFGPRFLYSAMPWMLLLTARSLTLLAGSGRAVHGVPAGTAAAGFMAVGILLGLGTVAPDRLREYHGARPVLNLHPDRALRAVSVDRAVVLIPDGWGSRLIARMWALGIPMRDTERIYAGVDACTLHEVLRHVERRPDLRTQLPRVLDSLTALGRPGIPFGVTPDEHLRLPADGGVTRDCGAEIAFDQRGFLAFAPFLYLNAADLDGPVIWARDLNRDNGALLARYPDREAFRYAPREPGGAPRLTSLEPTQP